MKHRLELFAFDSSSTTIIWGVSSPAGADWLAAFNGGRGRPSRIFCAGSEEFKSLFLKLFCHM
jgi:hypothetical protein